MKKTTKARPTKAATGKEKGATPPALHPNRDEELVGYARELRQFGVDPVEFLRLAALAERLFVNEERDPVRFLRECRIGLYAPSVIEAIVGAAAHCGGAYYRKESPVFRRQLRFLQEVFNTLRGPEFHIRDIYSVERARKVLALAMAVQAEADAVSEMLALELQPVEIALRKVAKRHGLTPAALRKRIERARKAYPSPAWPKKKARRL